MKKELSLIYFCRISLGRDYLKNAKNKGSGKRYKGGMGGHKKLAKNGLTEQKLGKKEYHRSGVTTSNLEYISQIALLSLLTESFFLLT